jgi:hypothetical protein
MLSTLLRDYTNKSYVFTMMISLCEFVGGSEGKSV